MSIKKIKEKITLYKTFFKVYYLLKNKKNIFFFPFYHIGGAEKVHLDILNCLDKKDTLTFITNESMNAGFKDEFKKATNLFELNKAIPYRYQKRFNKVFFKIINSNPNRVFFGCNSSFYYENLIHISPKSKKIDLIHAFSYEEPNAAEKISIPFVELIDTRVVLGKKTYGDFKALYHDNNIDEKLLEKITIIKNKVNIPEKVTEKSEFDPIRILFVGRKSYEKRPELFIRIAEKCLEKDINATFLMIGDFNSNYTDLPNVKIVGLLTDQDEIITNYKKAHLLLVTSSREGLPMVILESMAYGVVTVSTNVGEINELINPKNNNGYLIENTEDLEFLCDEFLKVIQNLSDEREKFNTMSLNAYKSVKENYSDATFRKKYKHLLQ